VTTPQAWENWEAGDFYIETRGPAGDGKVWLGLVCSACGNVQATCEGPPTDLGSLSTVAQQHYERKHAEGP
jgi:hypothetical protein